MFFRCRRPVFALVPSAPRIPSRFSFPLFLLEFCCFLACSLFFLVASSASLSSVGGGGGSGDIAARLLSGDSLLASFPLASAFLRSVLPHRLNLLSVLLFLFHSTPFTRSPRSTSTLVRFRPRFPFFRSQVPAQVSSFSLLSTVTCAFALPSRFVVHCFVP